MSSAEVERYKIEWFYGIDLYLKSEEGKQSLNVLLGDAENRDEVEYKVFLMLLETAIKIQTDLLWDEEQALSRWRSMHRENARNNYLAGRFARNDFWDQRAWDARYEVLKRNAESTALFVSRFIESQKAELEDEIQDERHTPIIAVTEDDLQLCAKPSDMVTLQCENDPEAMERVRKYLEEVGSDPTLIFRSFDGTDHTNSNLNRPKTIFPPSSVPPGSNDAVPEVPRHAPPAILPGQQPDLDESKAPSRRRNGHED